MGSFSYITFSDYPIFDIKNGYHEEIVNLVFQQSDYVCESRKLKTRNKLYWGDAYENESGSFEFKGFKQTVKICKQRLEIFGNSYKKSKADFNNAKKLAREREFYGFSLSGLTYDRYLEEIKNLIASKEKEYDGLFITLKDSLISAELWFYGQSLVCHLYSVLSVLPENEIVEYDLTDIIDGGWINELQAKSIEYEKVIILTEGKSDVEFISKSIEVLFPHLKDYYQFIDFDEYKVESNASALVKIVLSFAAAKVKHPIIALFDNDTTGIMEMKHLITKKLPNNIKVLKYPDIKIAKSYPTKGPTGNKNMNINGLACGIEMYFGKQVLTNENGLIPIQWKAYNEKEKKYQGEIAEKHFVQDSYRAKLKNKNLTELTEMTQLLLEIFNAYK
jgi:hypothetical protein